MFSKTCEYAIRATLFTAQKSAEQNKIGIDVICENIEAPKHFTAKILQKLVNNSVVSSKKGVKGGFYLSGEQLQSELINVVYAIDGSDVFTRCAIGLKSCTENKPCPIHCGFKDIREDLKNMLSNTTIESAAQKVNDGEAFLKL